jgi:hypothetical protein
LKVPPVAPFPRPGLFLIPPSGPGYYSTLDLLLHRFREEAPKHAWPRFSLLQFPYFDADFRYLDDTDNKDHDWLDPFKRVHLGDDFLFSTGGDFRFRYNNEVDSRLSGKDNVYELTRTRLYGDFWYRDVFRVYAEFFDAQTYNQDLTPLPTDHDHGDLLNLFADLKLCELADHPLYFRGGRQELLYGSQRLISPLEWTNARRTFQGAKAFWRGDDLDVDAFCVQPVVPNVDHFDTVDDQVVFSGVWVTKRPNKDQVMDFYYLDLDQARHVAVGNGKVTGAFNTSTVGSRYAGKYKGLLWDFEGMLQFGPYSNQHTFADAYTTGLGYYFKDVPLTPQFWIYFDHASGDPHPGLGTTHRTFNQLFPFGHYYFGYIDVVGRENINDLNFQAAIYPTKWITTYVQYHMFRLDQAKDALFSAAGVPLRIDPSGRAGTNVGDEIDVVVNFHLTTHQDLFVNYSHLYAGPFIRQTGPPGSPGYLYLQYSYHF